MFDIKVPAHIPIIVQGKYPYFHRKIQTGEERQSTQVQAILLTKANVVTKFPFVFNAYPCKSLVCIAFTGPNWAFTISHPSLVPVWSQGILTGSNLHDEAFQAICEATRGHPEVPVKRQPLAELLDDYQLQDPFRFAKFVYNINSYAPIFPYVIPPA